MNELTPDRKLSLLAELRAAEARFRADSIDSIKAEAVEILHPDRKAADTMRVCGLLADERGYLADLVALDLGQKIVKVSP